MRSADPAAAAACAFVAAGSRAPRRGRGGAAAARQDLRRHRRRGRARGVARRGRRHRAEPRAGHAAGLTLAEAAYARRRWRAGCTAPVRGPGSWPSSPTRPLDWHRRRDRRRRPRRGPALRRRARRGDRRDPAARLEGAASAGRRARSPRRRAPATRPAAGHGGTASPSAQAIEAGKSYLAAGAERLLLDTAGGPFPEAPAGGSRAGSPPPSPARCRSSWPAASSRPTSPRPCWRCPRSASTSRRAWRCVPSPLPCAPRRPGRVAVGRGRARTRCESRCSSSGPAPRGSTGRTSGPSDARARVAARARRAAAAGVCDRDFGGRYVPETLIAALERARSARGRDSPRSAFLGRAARAAVPLRRPADAALPGRSARRRDAGATRALVEAARLAGASARCRLPDRIRLYLKREDLNHTGAHKLNNALGQVLLTRRLGKSRVIAETGAGHARRGDGHGLRAARDPVRRPHGRRGHRAARRRTCCGCGRSGAEVRPVHGGIGDAQGRRQRGDARLGHQRRDLALLPGLDDGSASVPAARARLPARHRRRSGGPAGGDRGTAAGSRRSLASAAARTPSACSTDSSASRVFGSP